MAVKGLDYYPKVVDFYDDDKIFDLLEEYGPLGTTVYEVILTIVYAQGYYVSLSKDKLSRMVIKKIGNKWVKNKQVVVQVIDYCAEIGLFDKDLLNRNIITSVGIQKRYYKVAVKLMKRQLQMDEYWMLDKSGERQPLLSAPLIRESSEEGIVPSEDSTISSEESAIKERKEKEKKLKEGASPPPTPCGKHRNVCLTAQERASLVEKFGEVMTADYIERLSLHLFNSGRRCRDYSGTIEKWIREDREKEKGRSKPKNQFHNFEQRQTDYDEMLKRMNQEG